MVQLGAISLPLVLGGNELTVQFTVVSNEDLVIKDDILIGTDFMEIYQINLKSKPWKLTIEGNEIPLHNLSQDEKDIQDSIACITAPSPTD